MLEVTMRMGLFGYPDHMTNRSLEPTVRATSPQHNVRATYVLQAATDSRLIDAKAVSKILAHTFPFPP